MNLWALGCARRCSPGSVPTSTGWLGFLESDEVGLRRSSQPRLRSHCQPIDGPNTADGWSEGLYSYDSSINIYEIDSKEYNYDGLNRLAVFRDGMVEQGYTHDSFGNLSSITSNGTPRTLAVDALTNRISCVNCYDAAGSMTSWGEGGTTSSYACNPTNQRAPISA